MECVALRNNWEQEKFIWLQGLKKYHRRGWELGSGTRGFICFVFGTVIVS